MAWPAIRAQLMAAISSSLSDPGTIDTGIGRKLAPREVKYDTSGPGPSFEVPAASTRMAMSRSSSIEFFDLLGPPPFAHHRLDLDVADLGDAAAADIEQPFGLFLGLGPHDVLDPEPVLEFARFDDRHQDDASRSNA